LGELVAHGSHALVTLIMAEEAHHDHLADHAVEQSRVIGQRHLPQRRKVVRDLG
jgi:hypothetical protein